MPLAAAPSQASSASSSVGPGAQDGLASSAAAGDAARSSLPVAHVDLSALAHNFGEVRRIVGARVRVLAMVKSNAYGHGAALCATALARAGCDSFGVATADEAAALRAAFASAGAAAADARIVVFGGVLPCEADALVAAGADVATQEIDVVRALGARAAALGTTASVHVKLDTGMHRLGVAPERAVDFVGEASAVPSVRVVALGSHFAQAESVTGDVTAGQLEVLLGTDRALRAAGFQLERHLANSAGILTRPEAHLDTVRPGIMLYGVAPDPSLAGRASLRPVMRLVARVVRVADVAAGEGIGYGHTYRTTRPTRVATVRCGYADGYPRALGNAGVAVVRGVRAPLVGRVCMDHAMFDVSDAGAVDVGDEVTLWGDTPAVDDIASLAGTISYELLARVGARVRRVPAGDDRA